jgi:hypothetical protein
VALVVAPEDAPVGQDDLGSQQLVGGQSVPTAEDPDPSAERQAGDADGRPAAGGYRAPVLLEHVVDVPELGTGAHGDRAVLDLDRIQRAEVDEDAGGRRAAREAMTAGADRQFGSRTARELHGVDDVVRRPAARDRLRPNVPEARHHRLAQQLVVG